jgi:chitinase
MAGINYAVGSNWGAGFIGNMTVPGGEQGLHGWTIEFDADFAITNIWNAVIVSHVGNHYVIGNADWNANVAAGGQASFGFQAATGTGGTAVSGLVLDGAGNPPPVVPTLSVADTSVIEGNAGTTQLAFTVTLSQAASRPVTVQYATANGSATAGSDYAGAAGTLTFAAGETSKTILVQVAGDTAIEANETLTLNLSAASGATIAHGAATGTIVNDDTAPLPTLSIGDARFAEGSAGAPGLGRFNVTLSAASTTPVTVHYATGDGTASAGSDYVAQSGTLTFAPGETQKTITIAAIGDATVEPDEGFSVVLSAPVGATIARGTGAGTITNDDAALLPTLSISDASVIEGNPGSGPGWFSTSGNQIVDSAGHAVQIAGVNWFGFESSTLAPHGLWARGYKEMMDQMVQLGFNTIRLPFSSDTLHSTAAPNGIDFTKNPDLQGLSALQIMDKIVDYAGQVGLRIILDHHRSDSGAGTSPNGLWYDAQHSDAQWVADWQMLAQRYANNPTVIGADLHNEPYNGTWGGGGPNDWAAAAERAGNAIGAVNPNWLIFVEGVGTYQGQSYWWGGNLMGVKDRPIQLDVANKLVYSPHDYPHSVYAQPWFEGDNFAAGLPAKFDQMWGYIYEQGIAPVYLGEFGTNLSDPKDVPWFQAITRYLGGDLNNDGVKDITAGQQGVSWTYWSWNPDSGDTGGILSDDWQTVKQAKVDYLKPIEFDLHGAAGAVPHADFVVTLSTPASQMVTVSWATVPGEAGAADFQSSSGTLVFAPGEQSKTISVAVTPDTIKEGNEHFSVILSSPVGATISDGTGVATIIDDDTTVTLPTLSIADSSFAEGSAAQPGHSSFVATLSAVSSTSVTVRYATADGTATAGSDYVGQSGTLTFAPGETQKTITVAAIGDATVEPDEGFSLVLSAPVGATIARGTGAGTITNDDAAPPPAGNLQGQFSVVDSWNTGFNADIVVRNSGAATSGWQIAVDMPYQISDIWNAQILSHDASGYVIGNAVWNGQIAQNGQIDFGFIASGPLNPSSVHVHGVGQPPAPLPVPTVPTGLAVTGVSNNAALLSWNPSSVPGGGTVSGYAIFENGRQVATTTATQYSVGSLAADTTYQFTVTAMDAAGSSAQASPVSAHTAVLPPGGSGAAGMFSPYIDMAMPVDADLAAISRASGIENFTLAFVLASDRGIGWQGVGSIADDKLANGTTILSQVQAIQAAGGNITISFGGAAGQEAALTATSATALQTEYQSVIDRYHINSIDFDIEGAAELDQRSIALRDQAIVGLEIANPNLKVSFTLPVLPTGLDASGLAVLQAAKRDGVRVDLVDVMAMDYGQSVDNNGQMGKNAVDAAVATEHQLDGLGLNAKIGVTPMIGVNDIASEVFTLADAQSLVDYAKTDPRIALLSMWSAARDNGNSAGAHYASPDSSGIAEAPFAFAGIFHQFDKA